jgi:hypothetical protein
LYFLHHVVHVSYARNIGRSIEAQIDPALRRRALHAVVTAIQDAPPMDNK